MDWIRDLPCAACGRPSIPGERNEAHHEPPKALGGGGAWHDRKTIPLCVACHTAGPQARHSFGARRNWERAVGVSVAPLIERLNAAYEMQRGGA